MTSLPQSANPPLFAMVPMPADIEDLPSPTNGPYYVIARNGVFVHKFTHHGRTLTEANEISHLPEFTNKDNAYFWYNEDALRLPAEMVGKVWSFFRSIYNQRHSEAMVNITFHPKAGYRVFVPPQRASGGGVESKFDPSHLDTGWKVVGTIHSHCDFSAFHSGIDTHDADDHDGIHMTIGFVDKNPPQVATMVSASGKRWNFDLADVIDGKLKLLPHPKWWERYVAEPAPANKGKHVSQWNGDRGYGNNWRPGYWNPGEGYQQASWLESNEGKSGPKAQAPASKPAKPNRGVVDSYDLESLVELAEYHAGPEDISDWSNDVLNTKEDFEQTIANLEALGIEVDYGLTLAELPEPNS